MHFFQIFSNAFIFVGGLDSWFDWHSTFDLKDMYSNFPDSCKEARVLLMQNQAFHFPFFSNLGRAISFVRVWWYWCVSNWCCYLAFEIEKGVSVCVYFGWFLVWCVKLLCIHYLSMWITHPHVCVYTYTYRYRLLVYV